MPFINMKLPEGVADHATKEALIHRMTTLAVEFFGEAARAHTMVLIEEVRDGGYGRADEVLTMTKMGLAPRHE